MKEKKEKQTVKKVESTKLFATFGKYGKEVHIECKKDGDKYVGLNGEFIPDWAVISVK